MKRIFDILFSLFFLVILFIPGLIISILILLISGSPIFFLQERIGRNERPFKLFKFRSMRTDAQKGSSITIGSKDSRITPIGSFIRKFKIDEWPQLINVLKGEMSFVGPRPEVPFYVKNYKEEQRKVFLVRPGITDLASIKYKNENERLAGKEDPDKYYRESILPDKLKMGVEYAENNSVWMDLRIMWKTFLALLS